MDNVVGVNCWPYWQLARPADPCEERIAIEGCRTLYAKVWLFHYLRLGVKSTEAQDNGSTEVQEKAQHLSLCCTKARTNDHNVPQ